LLYNHDNNNHNNDVNNNNNDDDYDDYDDDDNSKNKNNNNQCNVLELIRCMKKCLAHPHDCVSVYEAQPSKGERR